MLLYVGSCSIAITEYSTLFIQVNGDQRSEQRHINERLIYCALDQFVDVDKFLLKHNIHKSSLAKIDEFSHLEETIDHDGKRFLHNTQLAEKVTLYIRGRLSKAEQDGKLVYQHTRAKANS